MTTTRTVLLAPDKFKGTLSAAQVVDALRQGITQTAPQLRLQSCPIADGGDGTVRVVITARTHPPLAGWFTRGTGTAIPLTVEGEARAR